MRVRTFLVYFFLNFRGVIADLVGGLRCNAFEGCFAVKDDSCLLQRQVLRFDDCEEKEYSLENEPANVHDLLERLSDGRNAHLRLNNDTHNTSTTGG
jgi:hypothetical protein